MTVKFLVADSLAAVAAAAGLNPPAMDVPKCTLMLGDVITFPQQELLAFRVAQRWFDAAEGVWYLRLEQTPHPLSDEALAPHPAS